MICNICCVQHKLQIVRVSTLYLCSTTVVVVQSLSHIQLFVTPWTAARQASLSFTTSQSLLKLIFTESVMPSNHVILCCPLLLLPSIFPSITVFSTEWSFASGDQSIGAWKSTNLNSLLTVIY